MNNNMIVLRDYDEDGVYADISVKIALETMKRAEIEQQKQKFAEELTRRRSRMDFNRSVV